MKTLKCFDVNWPMMNVIKSLGLVMLLTGCANRTELVATQVVVKLPPAGLIVPCHKPEIQGTSPLITASEDVPKLKAALSKCAQQAEDYLQWRAKHEQTKREEND
ncbi:hypothetical protein [Vibrio sp. RE86]|jgi:hypothetical protein|uniref:Rz1-like lysis system protein LysC n=1 Tax=Vibrio sp. RE86 TaxID=2607605 RepID=UPI0020A4BB9A|nr:hypothetical protein [Vibrio sp. RE86]